MITPDSSLSDELKSDVRFKEGLSSCINCGTCSAICPAAEFYNYDPRELMDYIQNCNDKELEDLLKSDTIWYCGECMSCKTRCPRGNTPGLIVMALRNLSMDKGYFTESEKGRQQLFMKRVVGEWILNHGYCLYLEGIGTDLYPEQGPVWDWRQKDWPGTMKRFGANYKGNGPGSMRKIPDEALAEIKSIFDVTGGTERFDKIEEFSKAKAKELNIELTNELMNDYIKHIYTFNSNQDKIGEIGRKVRIPACHAGGRGLESRPFRQTQVKQNQSRLNLKIYAAFLFSPMKNI